MNLGTELNQNKLSTSPLTAHNICPFAHIFFAAFLARRKCDSNSLANFYFTLSALFSTRLELSKPPFSDGRQ